MYILGIDTSCDDTAAGVLRAPREVLSNEVATQFDLHAAFGGVVPEIASRAHTERVTRVVERAVERAGLTLGDLDAIAVTNRPGLVGSLIVGVAAAKSLAVALDIPLVGVHHIEAHCTAALADHPDLDYPFVALVASGGHTAVYDCAGPGAIEVICQTIDDAAGECFDKVAVLLDLPQPGGPAVSRLAESGDPKAVRFPRARVKGDSLAFSFSGLKTAVLYHLKGPGGRREDPDRADLGMDRASVAASFEQAAVDVLVDRSLRALAVRGYRELVVGGGVAANRRLRADLAARAPAEVRVRFPSMALCADNGAMIALRGAELLAAGITSPLDLDVSATGEPGALL
ncbi:MAG: tRNA (adenosine(37)-N6)-threonylcarbamoyltransferase complex transferase subunit TsaD [Planctomycetota bacterium]|nr:tRNA (adenosine(37)-N6)-threonylcarbamoyltransferase complex transferase subunit TsaD [Planctomycetota bacterium]